MAETEQTVDSAVDTSPAETTPTPADQWRADVDQVVTLPALMCCRGDLPAIAALADGIEDAPLRFSADEIYALCEWVLVAFAESQGGAVLADLCTAFGGTPSAYIGLTDPCLRPAFDRACLVSLAQAQKPQAGAEPAVIFNTPNPGE